MRSHPERPRRHDADHTKPVVENGADDGAKSQQTVHARSPLVARGCRHGHCHAGEPAHEPDHIAAMVGEISDAYGVIAAMRSPAPPMISGPACAGRTERRSGAPTALKASGTGTGRCIGLGQRSMARTCAETGVAIREGPSADPLGPLSRSVQCCREAPRRVLGRR